MVEATKTENRITEPRVVALTVPDLVHLNGVFRIFCELIGEGTIETSDEDNEILATLFNKIMND